MYWPTITKLPSGGRADLSIDQHIARLGMRIADFVLNLPASKLRRTAWLQRGPEGELQKTYSWSDVQQWMFQMAECLLDHGVSTGDRVVNLYPNGLNWAILDIACSGINAIHAPLDPRLSFLQKRACIEQLDPKVAFIPQISDEFSVQTLQFEPMNSRLRSPASSFNLPYSPQDVANILFTSGTTSEPMGVMLSHQNLVSNAMAKLDAMPQRPDDHRLNILPFAHAYARTCELSTWIMSGSSMETANSMESFFHVVEASKPSLINGVPRLFDCVVDRWRAFGLTRDGLKRVLGSRIRQLASGGAGLQEATRVRFADAGFPIFQGYGLTETSPTVCSNRASTNGSDACLEGVGPVVQGVEVRIDEDSRLWVSGDGVMHGYWKRPDATQNRIVNGWLDTGDLAEWLPENNCDSPRALRILGRADDVLVLSNGYKVNPIRIEQEVCQRVGFEHCLVVGNGRPFTVLLLPPDATARHSTIESEVAVLSRIQSALSEFPSYQVPKRVLFVSENWNSKSELCNFKGAVIRKRVEQAFHSAIDLAYSINL